MSFEPFLILFMIILAQIYFCFFAKNLFLLDWFYRREKFLWTFWMEKSKKFIVFSAIFFRREN
jgi:hypothetical protein